MSKDNQDYARGMLRARIARGELECGDLDNPALSKIMSEWGEDWDEALPDHMRGAMMYTVDFTDCVRCFTECLSCGKLLETEYYDAHHKQWFRDEFSAPPLSDLAKRFALDDLRHFARVVLEEGGE